MVSLKSINYGTRFCIFSIDSAGDLPYLPDQKNAGKDTLSTIRSCAQGSIAQSTDGTNYILTGDTNKWITYNTNNGNGGTIASGNITAISDNYIESLFN